MKAGNIDLRLDRYQFKIHKNLCAKAFFGIDRFVYIRKKLNHTIYAVYDVLNIWNHKLKTFKAL